MNLKYSKILKSRFRTNPHPQKRNYFHSGVTFGSQLVLVVGLYRIEA